jgi:hypothetical protein
MTTTTADVTMLDATPPAPGSAPRPAPELQADPSARLLTEPRPEAIPELQADPSLRFVAEPQEELERAYPAAPVGQPTAAPVARKSWREQRAERRRRRVWLEEVLAWVLVPVIFIGAWWFVDAVLTALGTSPSAILNGLSAITSAL